MEDKGCRCEGDVHAWHVAEHKSYASTAVHALIERRLGLTGIDGRLHMLPPPIHQNQKYHPSPTHVPQYCSIKLRLIGVRCSSRGPRHPLKPKPSLATPVHEAWTGYHLIRRPLIHPPHTCPSALLYLDTLPALSRSLPLCCTHTNQLIPLINITPTRGSSSHPLETPVPHTSDLRLALYDGTSLAESNQRHDHRADYHVAA